MCVYIYMYRYIMKSTAISSPEAPCDFAGLQTCVSDQGGL